MSQDSHRIWIIDGTGEDDDVIYNTNFDDSFCHTIYRHRRTASSYERGPATFDGITENGEHNTNLIASKVLANIKFNRIRFDRVPSSRAVSCINGASVTIPSHLVGVIKPDGENIFLIGYSRGAAAAIRVAQEL
jgi:hypothetical protein